MYVIANNITTRNSAVNRIFRDAKAEKWAADGKAAASLREIVEKCRDAGADALEIDLEQHQGTPEAMEWAVKTVRRQTDLQLCLSANSAEVLEAGLKATKHAPVVNYVSAEEPRLRDILPLVASYKAGVILLVSDPASPADAREMLQKTAILVGAANETGIPNEHLHVDPGLIHVTSALGQRHLPEVIEFLRALPDATDPVIKSVCWLSNSSAGAPQRLRGIIETSLLPLLAGAGLSSVFLDVLKMVNRRSLRLMKIFNNEVLYSDGELEP